MGRDDPRDPVEELAAYLAHLHPAWHGRRWSDIGEDTRELFRADAREAANIYEGKSRWIERAKLGAAAAFFVIVLLNPPAWL